MSNLPTGTLTLLFTDIEGSTKLLHDLGHRYQDVLEQHRYGLRATFSQWNGHEVNTQGDGFFVVFSRATDAMQAALAAQTFLISHDWPDNVQVRVRMGLHTGEPSVIHSDLVGTDVHRAARIMAAGHGGQILVSHSTHNLIRDNLPDQVALHDLGEHHLKDLAHPERLFQLVALGLPRDFPPLRSINNRPHNLPQQLTPLLGRQADVTAVCDLLQRDDIRLCTLTGPGGIGKTRLSLQIASEMLAHFQDGVFFISLAPVSDPRLVSSTIAQTLGIREQTSQPILDTLAEYLHGKAMLLVLDNFEQVVTAAPAVGELLTACPQLKVLTSSRIALRLRGEQEYPVPALALPKRNPPPPVESLSQYSAVQLFIARAQSVKPTFELSVDNVPAIAEICVRLDGLPLAIELAAARIKLLSPQAMLSRLQNRLGLLTGGSRDLPERQQTLRNAIAWSYDLLDDNEKVLLRRLAIFAGGCTFEAVETVCKSAGDLQIDTLDGVSSLVDKNLVRQREEQDGEPRFWLLETIRAFAWEQLDENGEKAGTQQSHADYYLSLIQSLRRSMDSAEHYSELHSRVELEQDNLRSALTFLIGSDLDKACCLIEATYQLWLDLGLYAEGRDWLEKAMGQNPQPQQSARLLFLAGELSALQSDVATAQVYLDKAAKLATDVGDKVTLAAALNCLSATAMQQGDINKARDLMEAAITATRETGDKRLIIDIGASLALQALEEGDLANARILFEESLELRRELRQPVKLCLPLCNLGLIARYQGDLERATALLDEGLRIQQITNNKDLLGTVLFGQGWVARDRGQWEEGTAKFRNMLGVAIATGHKRGIVNGFNGLASIALGMGDAQRAARLLAAGETLLHSIGGTTFPCDRPDYERDVTHARTSLGDANFSTAWDEGEQMPLEQAISYALTTCLTDN